MATCCAPCLQVLERPNLNLLPGVMMRVCATWNMMRRGRLFWLHRLDPAVLQGEFANELGQAHIVQRRKGTFASALQTALHGPIVPGRQKALEIIKEYLQIFPSVHTQYLYVDMAICQHDLPTPRASIHEVRVQEKIGFGAAGIPPHQVQRPILRVQKGCRRDPLYVCFLWGPGSARGTPC